MTDYEAAVEIREALVAIAEQLDELSSLTERIDVLNDTATRIAAALEQLVRQHYAASSAAHGPLFHTLLSEENSA